jgi:tetratricopeptide (TPR) repeat protein
MSRKVLLAAAALACALAVPATAALAQNVDQSKIGPSVDDRSLYGTFLAGREAMRLGDTRSGASLLIGAAETQPNETVLRERAFTAALMSGDITAAARFAPAPDAGNQNLRGLGRVTEAVEALAVGKGADAAKALEAPVGFPHHAAALLLKPYAQAAAGQWDLATAEHDAEGERLVQLLDRASRAQLLELRGKNSEAEALYKLLVADPLGASLYQVPYGEFLERRGRWAEAVAFLDTALKQPNADSILFAARARAARREPPPAAPDLRQGAAQAMSYASAAMGSQRQGEISLIYARLALRLNPALDQAWVFAGDSLVLDHNEPDARDAWAKIGAASQYFVEARVRTAYSFQRSGDLTAGLDVLRAMARTHAQNLQVQYAFADLLRAHEDYAEAGQTLDHIVVAGGDRDWRVLYMRAVVRDKLGRWGEAKTDLNNALVLSPNEPELLNFLGYNLIDRGEDVKAGLALVERAVASQPRSGAMQDSLGWAHFRMGDYPKAVEILEAAVLLEPSDASVNDHLGDAYWMAGRREEAGFQWRRVLSLDPTPALKASSEVKLKDGLGPKAKLADQVGGEPTRR